MYIPRLSTVAVLFGAALLVTNMDSLMYQHNPPTTTERTPEAQEQILQHQAQAFVALERGRQDRQALVEYHQEAHCRQLLDNPQGRGVPTFPTYCY